MPDVCILTDSTAQFTHISYPGSDCVHVLPWRFQPDSNDQRDPSKVSLSELPTSLSNGSKPILAPPTVKDFIGALTQLSKQYYEIVLLLSSSQFAPVVKNAQRALQSARCPAAVHLIDSKNISVGLGMLVQAAAQTAENYQNGAAVSHEIRGLMPHIYSLFCLPDLTYLVQSQHLEMSQAYVGELLKLMPFFVLEEGRLVPIQKARTSRHLMETIYEFIAEFEDLAHVALVYGQPPLDREGCSLRERILNATQSVPVTEHVFNASAGSILGPHCLGVAVMEDVHLDKNALK